MKASTVRVEEALAYQNPQMVSRYAKRHNVSIENAQTLFEECKKFLVLCATAKGPISPSKELDEMWHFFITHTKDYDEYCGKYFGRFIHHIPTDEPTDYDAKPAIELAGQLFGASDVYVLKMMAVANEAECSNNCSSGSCSGCTHVDLDDPSVR